MTLGPPVPPFTEATARQKVQAAEDAWNGRDPAEVALAYTEDSLWRNRDAFFSGRSAIEAFLIRTWGKEGQSRLIKELWAFSLDRIAVRFVHESQDAEGGRWRSHGNENWPFDADGYMAERHASINDVAIVDVAIVKEERPFRRPHGRRPDDHPG